MIPLAQALKSALSACALLLAAYCVARWETRRELSSAENTMPCSGSHVGELATLQPPETWHPTGVPDPHYFVVCARDEAGQFAWLKLDRARTPGLERR